MPEGGPAAWDGLREALGALPAESIVLAIRIQLQFQPSKEVYEFLSRTLGLASKAPVLKENTDA